MRNMNTLPPPAFSCPGIGSWADRLSNGTKKALSAGVEIADIHGSGKVFDAEAVLGGLATLSLDDDPSGGWSHLQLDVQE